MNPYRRLLLKASALSALFPLKSFAQNRLFKLPFYMEIEVPKNYDPAFRKSESSNFDIDKINEQYKSEGKILAIEATEKPDAMVYNYKFANYEVYREWNDKVYHQNAPFKRSLAANGTKFKRFF